MFLKEVSISLTIVQITLVKINNEFNGQCPSCSNCFSKSHLLVFEINLLIQRKMRKTKKYQCHHFFTLEQLPNNGWVCLNNTTNFSDTIPKYWTEWKHIHIMKKKPLWHYKFKAAKEKDRWILHWIILLFINTQVSSSIVRSKSVLHYCQV